MATLPITHELEGSFLSNSQHEMYCRGRAAGYSQSEAARRANYPTASAHNTGCRLEKRPDVQRRIRELAATIQPTALATKQWVVLELLENHRLARKEKNIIASKQCLELVARLQGFLVEKRETDARSVRFNVSGPVSELRDALRTEYAALPPADREAIELEVPGVSELSAQQSSSQSDSSD